MRSGTVVTYYNYKKTISYEQRIGINLFATEIELCGGKQNDSEQKIKENEKGKQENDSNLPF